MKNRDALKIISLLFFLVVSNNAIACTDDSVDENAKFVNCKRMAEQGISTTQYMLGKMYATGTGVKQNYKKALYWYRKSAERGLTEEIKPSNALATESQFELGIMYLEGIGVLKDIEKSAYWFELSAKRLNPKAQYLLSTMYAHGDGVAQSFKKAIFWQTKAANNRFSPAQYALGKHYYYGSIVTQDYEKALFWIRKAAVQGLTDAQFTLGVMYDKGEGVKKDQEKALKWYMKAAENGYDNALRLLAMAYEYGFSGVKQDYIRSHMYYNVIARKGSEDDKKSRDQLTKKMTPEQLSIAQEKAEELLNIINSK